jgi:hypothetical protein
VYNNYPQLKITQICDIDPSISNNNPCSTPEKKKEKKLTTVVMSHGLLHAAGKPHSVLVKNRI